MHHIEQDTNATYAVTCKETVYGEGCTLSDALDTRMAGATHVTLKRTERHGPTITIAARGGSMARAMVNMSEAMAATMVEISNNFDS